MSRELVLLSREPFDIEAWAQVAGSRVGHGSATLYVGELTKLSDTEGREMISVWQSRHLENHRDADADLGQATAEWDWWTDISLPLADGPGRDIAEEMAARAGGRIVERA